MTEGYPADRVMLLGDTFVYSYGEEQAALFMK